jgi:hypothetical protein
VQLRSLVLCIAILAATAACESSTDPILGETGGGGTLTVSQASGNWNLTVTRTSNLNCSGALASGQVIATHIEVLSDGTVTTPSTWQNPVAGGFQNLSGSVNLATGAVDLIFAGGVGGAMELFPGTMSSSGTITGATLTDPAPGSSQVFGSNGCQYTVTGTKTS